MSVLDPLLSAENGKASFEFSSDFTRTSGATGEADTVAIKHPAPTGSAAGNLAYWSGTAWTVLPNVLAGDGWLSLGSAPAGQGAIRLSNGAQVRVRNAANSSEIRALEVDSSDRLSLGEGSDEVVLHATSSLTVRLDGSDAIKVESGGLAELPGADLKNAALKNFHNARGNWTTIQDTGTAGAGSDDAATDGATVAYPLPTMANGAWLLIGVQVDTDDGITRRSDGFELLVVKNSVSYLVRERGGGTNEFTGSTGSITITGDDSGDSIGVALSSDALTFSLTRTAGARSARVTLWHHDPKDGPS